MTAKKDAQEGSQHECFNCEYCDFTCRKKGIMNKHMKTDHENVFGLDYKHFPCDFVYRKIHIIFPTSGAFRNIAK